MQTQKYVSKLAAANRLYRLTWNFAYRLLYRPSPVYAHAWRRALLRLFGAQIASDAIPYPKCRIWAPKNLTMESNSCLANDVECYSVGHITLGPNSTVSQHTHLCTATHDYEDQSFELVVRPIVVGAQAWIATRAFIGPGVTVGEGAVVGATASVYKNVDPWLVVGGNPAKVIKRRSRKQL